MNTSGEFVNYQSITHDLQKPENEHTIFLLILYSPLPYDDTNVEEHSSRYQGLSPEDVAAAADIV